MYLTTQAVICTDTSIVRLILGGSALSGDLRLTFLENLLASYNRIEESFMKTVYRLRKAINFRTLWEVDSPLATFRRIASENAGGTGRLNAMTQLTSVLQHFETIENQAVRCFTTNIYTPGIKRWTFDSVKNKSVGLKNNESKIPYQHPLL